MKFKLVFLLLAFFNSHCLVCRAAPTVQKNIFSNFSSSYFGTYRFISVFDSKSYDSSGSNPLLFNTLFLNYNVYSSYFIGLVLGLEVQPLNFSRSYLYNPAVRVGNKKLINNENVKLSADLRLVAPLNEEAGRQKLVTAIVSQDYLVARPIKSKFFIDSFAIFRWQFFQQNLNGRTLYLFDRTGLNYELSEYFALSISSIIQAYIENRPTPQSLQADNLRLGPGFILQFKDVELDCYLTMNTAQPSIKDAALLVLLFARIL